MFLQNKSVRRPIRIRSQKKCITTFEHQQLSHERYEIESRSIIVSL